MANTVTSQTLLDNEKHCVIKFTNLSDGTAETLRFATDVNLRSRFMLQNIGC